MFKGTDKVYILDDKTFGGSLLHSDLTDTQKAIIVVIQKNPSLTMEEIGARIGLGRTSVYQNIKILKEKGSLKREGRKMDGKWKINNY